MDKLQLVHEHVACKPNRLEGRDRTVWAKVHVVYQSDGHTYEATRDIKMRLKRAKPSKD